MSRAQSGENVLHFILDMQDIKVPESSSRRVLTSFVTGYSWSRSPVRVVVGSSKNLFFTKKSPSHQTGGMSVGKCKSLLVKRRTTL